MRAWIAGRVPDAGVAGASPVIRNVSAQALDDSALDMAAPGADKLFDECARLALPGELRKKALGDLCLRELAKNEKRLVVHPGSGGRAKRWPLSNFIEVIRRAASRGVEGVLVTGEAEADLETSLRGLKLPAGWVRVSRLPAQTLAGLVAESTHYLGNDSGPTHLAAACGASVLALFREDNLPAWRPFGQTRVLAAASMAGIPLDDVLVAFDDFLAT
jgi:ADP-heptose:LPS heptosyltransferase